MRNVTMRHAVLALSAAALMGCAADMQKSELETAAAAPTPAAGQTTDGPSARGFVPVRTGETYAPGTPQFAALSIDKTMLSVIKHSEGLRLAAYQGPSGAVLIGYGHKRTAQAGMTITEAEAEALLRDDLAVVEGVIRNNLKQPISVNEFSAMVDLAYNIGTGNFRTSSVLKRFNAGDRQGAADAFLLWNKVTQGGQRVVSPHLAERRELERRHFLGGDPV